MNFTFALKFALDSDEFVNEISDTIKVIGGENINSSISKAQLFQKKKVFKNFSRKLNITNLTHISICREI